MNITEVVKVCHELSKEKGFWDKSRNVAEMLMLIVSELSEALEAHREDKFAIAPMTKCKTYNATWLFESYIEGTFEEEIADVFIRLFDLCGGLNIDIEYFIDKKIEYNKTRPYLHNKKY